MQQLWVGVQRHWPIGKVDRKLNSIASSAGGRFVKCADALNDILRVDPFQLWLRHFAEVAEAADDGFQIGDLCRRASRCSR